MLTPVNQHLYDCLDQQEHDHEYAIAYQYHSLGSRQHDLVAKGLEQLSLVTRASESSHQLCSSLIA